MNPTITTAKELASRANDGVEVTLLWHPDEDLLTVSVSDRRTGDAFELNVESENAMDAFHHPFAYAAHHGVEYQLVCRALPEPVAA